MNRNSRRFESIRFWAWFGPFLALFSVFYIVVYPISLIVMFTLWRLSLWKTRRLLGSSPQLAWLRCKEVFSKAPEVAFFPATPCNVAEAEHFVQAFVRQFPNSQGFLIERLYDSDPMVAAYVIKCLIELKVMSMDRIDLEKVEYADAYVRERSLNDMYEWVR